MHDASEHERITVQADALIADVRRKLDATAGYLGAHADAAGAAVLQRRGQRQEQLRQFVFEQVAAASGGVPDGAQETPADAHTVFARRVRHRRALV